MHTGANRGTRNRKARQPAPTAVLLLAYGGPDSLDDIPAYLLDIRGGRETPQHLIDEVTERYRQIGGRSPLLEITRSLAGKLSGRTGLPVYVGMRHWHPYIRDVVAQMVADGVRHIVAICMAPHYSALSIGVYQEKLEAALEAVEEDVSVSFVRSWGTQPEYLDGIAGHIRETLVRFPEEVRHTVKVIFTAHSLPEFILERGDPYEAQLHETARLLAARLNLPSDRWLFSYQSAARTGVPWLGPQVEDLIPELAARGDRNLIIAPIGFVADHLEVLYDIDIGMQEMARKYGLRVERPPMLNDSEPLVAALASLVDERRRVAT
ncbi:MAG TPA: ferrochelatase [Chloroflexi bacterium]|nr:ferrochelatase [Chloroflexota bacterium]